MELRLHYQRLVNTIMRIGPRRLIFAMVTVALTASAQGNAPSSAVKLEDTGKIVQFLSSAVSWYRQRAAEEKLANEPGDLTFVQENNTVADQVVQQAFEYGRNEAQLQSKHRSEQQTQTASDQNQRLIQALQKLEQEIQDTQAELQSNREKLPRAGATRRKLIAATIEELQ